jgi:cysteine desulfurase
LEKQLHGANHERNKRPGTENIIEIVGLGKACELVTQELLERSKHMRKMRDLLFKVSHEIKRF